MKQLLSPLFILLAFSAAAQLKIDNAVFFIQPGATVTLQGDITSNVDIQGTGLLLLKGSAVQQVDMGGNTIPNLEIDNTSNVTLQNTNARIGNSLLFTNGKIQTGNFDILLNSAATITGANASKFVWTNGTGQLKKELTADITNYELPVGENANYRPAYLTTSASSYLLANFGVRVLGSPDANKPPSTTSFLKTTWPVTKTGITGGTVTLAGQYIDPADVTGTEANIVGYFNNGTDWSSAGETHNAATNIIAAPVTANTGSVSGINKFLLVGAKAFLQGAYDPITGLMTDNLRTLPFGSSASTANFPSTDPYRVAPYSTAFTQIANANTETITSSAVVTAQSIPVDNIVDWVFLELRNLNASPGNTILQTRSALIQKDGDIVDVDGVSPVTFNNLANGNYIIAIRHRNHLGLSIDQTSGRAINETKSTAFTTNAIDFRIAADAQLFGTATAFTTAAHPVSGTVNLLWGGNANFNNQTRFTSLNNDRDHLLINSLGNVPSSFINSIYHSADVNMNKAVRFSGLNNDRDYILITVLGNVPSTFKTQALPN
ncbi:MAG: hypothetical protein ACQUYJ_16010 [Ferruginibacter sp.]